jgi:hypothetical protein
VRFTTERAPCRACLYKGKTMPINIALKKLDDESYSCTVDFGDVHIGADGDDAVTALHAASGLAHDLSAAMDKHPELAALLPPQATAALKAIRIASWAIKNGKLPEAINAVGPKAVSAVKSVLKSIF